MVLPWNGAGAGGSLGSVREVRSLNSCYRPRHNSGHALLLLHVNCGQVAAVTSEAVIAFAALVITVPTVVFAVLGYREQRRAKNGGTSTGIWAAVLGPLERAEGAAERREVRYEQRLDAMDLRLIACEEDRRLSQQRREQAQRERELCQAALAEVNRRLDECLGVQRGV